MMRRAILAAAAFVMAASAAAVQPSAAPPEASAALDPAALAEARNLLHATGFEAQLEASVIQSGESSFATVMRQMETQAGRDFPVDLEARIRNIMREHLVSLAADMRPTALENSSRVYARYFTAEEIRELRRLQTHPVMVRFQRFAPQFMNDLTQLGVAAAARRLPRLMERLRTETEAWQREQRQPAGAE